MLDKNELQAIKKCQSGNTESFGILYDKYIKKIYDFVYYKTMHKETAEDLVSDIFIKALDKINSFDAQKGSFNSWIYRIARNTVIDHYRTQKKDKNIDDVWDLSSNEDIAVDVDVRAQMEKVQEHLSKLKAEQRDIVVMRLWQGMSHKEIADVLEKNESAVKVAYSRLISQMRKEVLLLILTWIVINI